MDKDKEENADFLMDDDLEDEGLLGLPVQEIVESSEENLAPLVFNLMEMHFSVGEIYWNMSSGKKITLFHPGDWIRKEYLQKFLSAGKDIQIDSILNEDYCSKGLNLFDKFLDSDEENEKSKFRDSIIGWLCDGYWNNQEQVGLADLMFVCEQSFFNFDGEEEKKIFNASADLMKRSSIVGSLLVSLAIVMGYLDKNLLKDLYHLSFLFDISLDENVLSTNLINALEQERKTPQSWHSSLGENEVSTFKSHSELGVGKAFAFYENKMSNPGLLNFIETHHERINGLGFPLGLKEGEISDLEGLIIFVNNRFPYSDMTLRHGDACSYLRVLMEKNEELDAVLTNRIKKIVTNEFENRDSEHAKYLEVSGI